jgi:hypothetical protein
MAQILPFRHRMEIHPQPTQPPEMTADEAYRRWGFEHAPLEYAEIDTLVASLNEDLPMILESTDIDQTIRDFARLHCVGLDADTRIEQQQMFSRFADAAAESCPEHYYTLNKILEHL